MKHENWTQEDLNHKVGGVYILSQTKMMPFSIKKPEAAPTKLRVSRFVLHKSYEYSSKLLTIITLS